MENNLIERLALLRKPFEAHQISKLPKPLRRDAPKGNCKECGGYHGLPAIHLDYVGHAALTDRLLDVDPAWTWEPLSTDEKGLPTVDQNGGMWIKLTICGVTRLGYGDAQGKIGGDAVKERIGDALRNAAMRFGAALDLWHKGDLHKDEDDQAPPPKQAKQQQPIEDSAYLTFEKQWKEDMDNAALAGPKTLQASFDSMPVGPHKQEFWKRHGAALKAAAQKAVTQAEAA